MLKSSPPGPVLTGNVKRNASANSHVSSPTATLPPVSGRSLSPTIVSGSPSVPETLIVSPSRMSTRSVHSTSA